MMSIAQFTGYCQRAPVGVAGVSDQDAQSGFSISHEQTAGG